VRRRQGEATRTWPQAVEKISYGIPTFYFNGNLVHFAAYDHHIGFYPTPGDRRDRQISGR